MQRAPHPSWRAPLVSGLASALAVGAIFLAAGAFDDDAGRAGGAATTATTTTAADLSVRDLFRRARLGVVLVEHRPPGVRPRTGPPRRDDGIATGSGFVVDRAGHVVTNQHIVAGRGTTTVQLEPGEDPVRATIIGRDAANDLALVRVAGVGSARLRPLPLGDSRRVGVGDQVVAIGNPFGFERSLSAGVVSGTDRRITAPDGSPITNAVQTDAAINPGNSGGPLLDDDGRVIGVISQARSPGLGFAIPVDTVRRFVAREVAGCNDGWPAAAGSRPSTSYGPTR